MPKSSIKKTNDNEEKEVTRAKKASSATAKKAVSTSAKKTSSKTTSPSSKKTSKTTKSASKKVASKTTEKPITKKAVAKKSDPKTTVKPATKKASAKTTKVSDKKASSKKATKNVEVSEVSSSPSIEKKSNSKIATTKSTPETKAPASKSTKTSKTAKETTVKSTAKSKVTSKTKKTVDEVMPKVEKEVKKTATKAKKKIDEVTPKVKKEVKKTATKAKKKIDEVAPKVKEEVKKTTKTKKKADEVASKAKKETKKTTTKVKKTTKKSIPIVKDTLKKVVTKAKKKINELTSNFLDIVEYYDLPYRYNQTTVKVLAQDPNTLFVYWDINDNDLQYYKEQYGDNFLYITKPVLVVHNITQNYSFEIDINDFANNWYIHVNDTKCKYIVELGRRPNQSNKIFNVQNSEPTQFVKILSSNEIENPNDRVLFYEDKQKLHFKNVKTNVVTEKIIDKKQKKHFAEIYKYFSFDDSANSKFDFENPSSNNPTSNVMK